MQRTVKEHDAKMEEKRRQTIVKWIVMYKKIPLKFYRPSWESSLLKLWSSTFLQSAGAAILSKYSWYSISHEGNTPCICKRLKKNHELSYSTSNHSKKKQLCVEVEVEIDPRCPLKTQTIAIPTKTETILYIANSNGIQVDLKINKVSG